MGIITRYRDVRECELRRSQRFAPASIQDDPNISDDVMTGECGLTIK